MLVLTMFAWVHYCPTTAIMTKSLIVFILLFKVKKENWENSIRSLEAGISVRSCHSILHNDLNVSGFTNIKLKNIVCRSEIQMTLAVNLITITNWDKNKFWIVIHSIRQKREEGKYVDIHHPQGTIRMKWLKNGKQKISLLKTVSNIEQTPWTPQCDNTWAYTLFFQLGISRFSLLSLHKTISERKTIQAHYNGWCNEEAKWSQECFHKLQKLT